MYIHVCIKGRHRTRLAMEGLRALQDRTDTLIVVPNQNLFKLVDQNTTVYVYIHAYVYMYV
jgi:cell division GTPase FtsZ